MKFYIYKFTNILNNKVYIGMTSCIKRRYKDHINTAAGIKSYSKVKKQLIHKAINKYGIENFKFEIIHEINNFKECCDIEINEIAKYNSTCCKYGYNILKGGSGFLNSLNRSLFNKDIKDIFKYYLSDDFISINDVAKKYKCCKQSIKMILDRESYLNVPIPKKLIIGAANKRSKKQKISLVKRQLAATISVNDVISIFDKYATGKFTLNMLSKEFKLKSLSTILFILNRDTWKNILINEDILKKVNYYLNNRNDFYFCKIKNKLIFKENTLLQCIKAMLDGYSLRQAAYKNNISATFLCDILREKHWKNVYIDDDILYLFKCKYPNYLLNRMKL